MNFGAALAKRQGLRFLYATYGVVLMVSMEQRYVMLKKG